ncbi:hypothetical protein [uncultured Pseudoteredinibacter sp.]|uniref:hypothetical protein n=1 Tax=uncultured Pseudoteredinibacter sp. TaxID=1641701 RepID=UPI00260399B2|nr:hypothetical protein [uncultured Pseudoteredinibacter sp.]
MKYKLKLVVPAALFGVSMGLVPPYPYTYQMEITLGAMLVYYILGCVIKKQSRNAFQLVGFLAFLCMLVVIFWFWHLSIPHGIWFPPDYFPVVQQFYQVDGESGYDAKVSNIFITLWLGALFIIWIRHLTRKLTARLSASDAQKARAGY